MCVNTILDDLGIFYVNKFGNIFVKKFPLPEHVRELKPKRKLAIRASFGNFRKYFQILVKKTSLDFLLLLHQGKRKNLRKIGFF